MGLLIAGFALALALSIRFTLADAPELQPDRGHDRYALVVGVSEYARLPNIPEAEINAILMASMLEANGYALMTGGPLINPDQTRFRYATDAMGRLAEDGADVFVYFSGHTAPAEDELFLLTRDAQAPPLVLYDEGGMRIEELWSHPAGRFPSQIDVVIETEGVRGLMGDGINAVGTGLPDIEAPPGVTLVFSDRGGALDLRLGLVRQNRNPFQRVITSADVGPSLFTRLLAERGLDADSELYALFQEISTRTFEASSGDREPVILRTRRSALSQRNQLLIDYSQQDFPTTPPPTSDAGLDVVKLVAMFEAFRADVYRDIAGIQTIGFGHTGEAVERGQISLEEGYELLYRDMASAAEAVDRLVDVELNENQRNALISLVFNIGEGAFSRSNLLRRVNENYRTVTAAEFLRWRHFRNSSGAMEVSRGLQLRREQEAFLFMLEPGRIDPVDFIISFEQFNPTAEFVDECYRIGFGSPLEDCGEADADFTVSYLEAIQMLRQEIDALEWRLEQVVEVPLSYNQRVALKSFALDEGFEALENSAILQRLNNGDYANAANAIRMYDSLTELRGFDPTNGGISRRAAEAALFFSNGGLFVGTNE
jgi:lysozyme